jgi:hypothetical protein
MLREPMRFALMSSGDPMKMTMEERFWSKVRKAEGCWVWAGTMRGAYGTFSIGARSAGQVGAHRMAWQLTNGPIAAGLFVCHRCDNPPCVNPDHLFLGTVQDNVADMVAKGRGVAADRHGCAKLTREQAQAVLDTYFAGGITIKETGRTLGVPRGTVRDIVCGRAWKELYTDAHRAAFPGLAKQNTAVRHPKGGAVGVSKLSDHQVAEMRGLYEAGLASQYQLADRFGVHQATVHRIVSGKGWTHV